MAILAASTTDRNTALCQGSQQVSITGHMLKFAFQLQQAIGSVSQYLFLRAYFAASFCIYYVLFVTQIFTFQSLLASRFVARKTGATLTSICQAGWNSREIRRLRKRIEFEFFVLILSPSGNSLFLLFFWPGWILIAAAIWGLSIWAK